MGERILSPTPTKIHIVPDWWILREVYGESNKYISLSFDQPYSERVLSMPILKIPIEFYKQEEKPTEFVAILEIVREKRKYYSVKKGEFTENVDREVLYARLPEYQNTKPILLCVIAALEGKHTDKSNKFIYNDFLTEKEPIYYRTATNYSSTGRHWLDMIVIVSESDIILDSRGNTPHAHGRRIFKLEVNTQ